MSQHSTIDHVWLSWVETVSDPHSPLEAVLVEYSDCDPDYRIDARRLPDHLIYEVVENGVHAVFAETDRIIEAGQLLWVPPGVEHSFRPAVEGTRARLYHFRFVLTAGCPLGNPVVLGADAHRQERFARLYESFGQNSGADQSLWRVWCRAALTMTFIEIAGVIDQQHLRAAPTLSPPQRQAIIQAVDTDLWCEPRRLAELTGYHPAYFARLFKRSFGLSPRSWVLHQRMARAASLLLESGDQVSELAASLGYTDAFVFSRQFRQVHGVSPRLWRQQHAQTPP